LEHWKLVKKEVINNKKKKKKWTKSYFLQICRCPFACDCKCADFGSLAEVKRHLREVHETSVFNRYNKKSSHRDKPESACSSSTMTTTPLRRPLWGVEAIILAKLRQKTTGKAAATRRGGRLFA
jgi:hypothetical protein